jgi:transposase-like protein
MPRNGSTPKRLKSQHGEVNIHTPRDRYGLFEPQFLKKGQTRLTQMDDQILTLYAKGLFTLEPCFSTVDVPFTFKSLIKTTASPSSRTVPLASLTMVSSRSSLNALHGAAGLYVYFALY